MSEVSTESTTYGHSFEQVYSRAIRLLSLREHSVMELERKLSSKGPPPAVIAEVLEALQRKDLQSDSRFIEGFVRNRLAKGHGPIRIRQELSQRGISDALVDEALTQTGEFWIEVAQRARCKRFGSEPVTAHSSVWNRQARFLARRGFPSDLIYRVLDALH
jgi:regulatory protein